MKTRLISCRLALLLSLLALTNLAGLLDEYGWIITQIDCESCEVKIERLTFVPNPVWLNAGVETGHVDKAATVTASLGSDKYSWAMEEWPHLGVAYTDYRNLAVGEPLQQLEFDLWPAADLSFGPSSKRFKTFVKIRSYLLDEDSKKPTGPWVAGTLPIEVRQPVLRMVRLSMGGARPDARPFVGGGPAQRNIGVWGVDSNSDWALSVKELGSSGLFNKLPPGGMNARLFPLGGVLWEDLEFQTNPISVANCRSPEGLPPIGCWALLELTARHAPSGHKVTAVERVLVTIQGAPTSNGPGGSSEDAWEPFFSGLSRAEGH